MAYFVEKRGEVAELKAPLKDAVLSCNSALLGELLTKVIGYSTMGIDCSDLFTEMIMVCGCSLSTSIPLCNASRSCDGVVAAFCFSGPFLHGTCVLGTCVDAAFSSVWMRVWVRACVCECICVCMCLCICACVLCVRVCIRVGVCVRARVCAWKYVCK